MTYRRGQLSIIKTDSHDSNSLEALHSRGALAAVLAMHAGEEITVPNKLLEMARQGEIQVRTRTEGGATIMWAEKRV